MRTLPPRDAPFESQVIVYMVEPPDTMSFTDLKDQEAMTLIKSVISESSLDELSRSPSQRVFRTHGRAP
jgi:hypothetical protein